jgi:glycosyltransferase involved in cell wall biosynthesis
MACYDDFRGVEFSAMSLLLHHAMDELIVVDNNPGSEHGQATAAFCGKHPQIKYVAMPEATGTTQPRERIFSEATGDFVLVLDCHVLFPEGAIARFRRWLAEHPECRDLLQGPLVLDNGGYHTQFNDQWRGGMWGVWGTAWHCPTCGAQFTTMHEGDLVSFRDQATSRGPAAACSCRPFPETLAWAGHERHLLAAGFQPLGWNPDDEPFDIPAHGLGIFAAKRDAWLGFNPHFRTFGGEEFYLHEKYRAAGRRTLCLPFLRWWHSFAKVGKGKFPNTSYGKARNYVLGHQELGLDLAPVHAHFCQPQPGGDGKPVVKVSPEAWEHLLADPIKHTQPPGKEIVTTWSALHQQPPDTSSLDAVFAWTKSRPRDLDQHLPALADLAAKCAHVTEFAKRRESTVGLLAGQPAELVSYQKELDLLVPTAVRLATETKVVLVGGGDSLEATIEPTDLLFLDTVHSASRLKAELDRHASKVRRFIAVRGTGAFGAVAEGKKEAGLFTALRPFVEDHPEWFVYSHNKQQYGITVLGKLEEDRPAKPVLAWPPGKGPGTELQKMLKTLGINPKPSCDCNGKAAQMDFWGASGCREHRETIIGWMRAGQEKWGWTEKLRAAANAVTSGLAFQLDVLDPFPSLIDEAIRRAEAQEAAAAA